jgi:LEA14-like dessication related protein
VLCLLLAALIASACARASWLEVRSVERLSVAARPKGEATLSLSLKVKTRAPLDAEVAVTSYRVSLAGRELGHGGALPALKVPAGGELELSLPVEVRLSALPPELPELLAKGALPYRAEVSLTAETALGRRRLRLAPAGEAPLGAGFTALFDGVFGGEDIEILSVGAPSLERGVFTFSVSARFPGYLPFAVTVKATDYSIAISELPIGRGRSGEAFVVAPGAGGVGRFTVDVPAIALPAVLAGLSRGGGLTVEGEAELEPVGPVSRVPFRIQAPLPRP